MPGNTCVCAGEFVLSGLSSFTKSFAFFSFNKHLGNNYDIPGSMKRDMEGIEVENRPSQYVPMASQV